MNLLKHKVIRNYISNKWPDIFNTNKLSFKLLKKIIKDKVIIFSFSKHID